MKNAWVRKVLATGLIVCAIAGMASAAKIARPNIVYIFIDDMGYGDIGPFGSTLNKTPELDRMAAEGMKMTQYYVSNTACTLSLAFYRPPCYL